MIVAGFGFRGAATVASLGDALSKVRGDAAPTHLAAPDDKVGAACFVALAGELGLPVIGVSAGMISATPTPTHSAAAARWRCAGSVAEAAALAAAGAGAQLLAPRSVSADRLATCAIAIGGAP